MATVAQPAGTINTLSAELYPAPTDADLEAITRSERIGFRAASEPDARKTFRLAVAEVATSAKTTLPECHARVDSAVKMALCGDVELLDDGKARVASRSNGQSTYLIVNGTCPCKDFERAPSNWCAHRIAAGLYKRAIALADKRLDAPPAPPAPAPAPAPVEAPEPPTPETAPSSAPKVPAQYIVMIQGKPFVKYAGLLQMAHACGLVSLVAVWTYNDAELSLAHAVALFADGRRFEEAGDATQANTSQKVAPHFRRVALTRAKARALRDALGIDLCSVEELAD